MGIQKNESNMTASEKWAKVLLVTERLNSKPSSKGVQHESCIQTTSKNSILCGSPVEYFSSELRTSSQRESFPIDELYGTYCHSERAIRIYIKNINRDAHLFGATDGPSSELLEIVRLHEWSHAVVHLGIYQNETFEYLEPAIPEIETSWMSFIAGRDTWFSGLEVEVHEFLAQALTYAAIDSYEDNARASKLKDVFDRLESKQPEYYRLPTDVKRHLTAANLPLALEAARGRKDTIRDHSFDLLSGLQKLVSFSQE